MKWSSVEPQLFSNLSWRGVRAFDHPVSKKQTFLATIFPSSFLLLFNVAAFYLLCVTIALTNRLSDFDIRIEEIDDILKSLKTNKAHGPDNISVSMIQLCGKDLCIPLQIIFKNILRTSIFPDQ